MEITTDNSAVFLSRRMTHFEKSVKFLGITNFDKQNNEYTDEKTKMAFDIFNFGWNCAKKTKGTHFVIGKIAKDDKEQKLIFSTNPTKHLDIRKCKREQFRLAKKDKNSIFVIYEAMTAITHNSYKNKIQKVQNTDDKLIANAKTKPYAYADDGFGNHIKVAYKQYCTVMFVFFNGENIEGFTPIQN